MAFLKLREENSTFQHVVKGTGGQVVLTLRIVPESEQKRIRREHTKTDWRHNSRERSDELEIANDLLNAAIVDWVGVCDATTEQPLPCTKKTKLLLPASLQTDVIRICAGRESDLDEEVAAAKNA